MATKIVDFDAKFFEYARKWLAAHPGLSEQQVEDSYNAIMREWIAAPADWLDGACPGDYFKRFDRPEELTALMRGYAEAKLNLPEPLYSRILELGEACAPSLGALLADDALDEGLRAQALSLLRDMDSRAADDALVDLVCAAQAPGELSDLAAEVLARRDARMADRLLERFEGAGAYARMLILDICVHYPGDARIYDYLVRQLKNDPERRALCASCLAKLGDARAIAPLREMLALFDLRYLDYMALCNAIEALGGDAGEPRAFYGDPDFEALRKL